MLFVIESGFAPSWSRHHSDPDLTGRGRLIATPLSFPIIKSDNTGFVPASIEVGKRKLPVETTGVASTPWPGANSRMDARHPAAYGHPCGLEVRWRRIRPTKQARSLACSPRQRCLLNRPMIVAGARFPTAFPSLGPPLPLGVQTIEFQTRETEPSDRRSISAAAFDHPDPDFGRCTVMSGPTQYAEGVSSTVAEPETEARPWRPAPGTAQIRQNRNKMFGNAARQENFMNRHFAIASCLFCLAGPILAAPEYAPPPPSAGPSIISKIEEQGKMTYLKGLRSARRSP